MKSFIYMVTAYPPDGGPGALRAAKFARLLPRYGWQPHIFTAQPEHDVHDPSLLEEVVDTPVVRVAGLQPLRYWRRRASHREPGGGSLAGDADRFRSLRRFVRRVAFFPDEMVFWTPSGVRAAVRLGDRIRPELILATQPNSVLLAGASVSHRLGIPLVADFRDEWARGGPSDDRPWVRRLLERPLEAHVIQRSRAVLCNTPGMREGFRSRYPGMEAWLPHIPNGYAAEDFPPEAGCRRLAPPPHPAAIRPLRVVYAGALYADYNPTAFLRGVGRAQANGWLPHGIELEFLGHHDREVVRGMESAAEGIGLSGRLVRPGQLPYKQALKRLVDADLVLLLMPNGGSSASRVTAKTYEAMASGRPILGMLPPGDARELVQQARCALALVDPEDSEGAGIALAEAARRLRDGSLAVDTDWGVVRSYERNALAGRLARVLDRVIEVEA